MCCCCPYDSVHEEGCLLPSVKIIVLCWGLCVGGHSWIYMFKMKIEARSLPQRQGGPFSPSLYEQGPGYHLRMPGPYGNDSRLEEYDPPPRHL